MTPDNVYMRVLACIRRIMYEFVRDAYTMSENDWYAIQKLYHQLTLDPVLANTIVVLNGRDAPPGGDTVSWLNKQDRQAQAGRGFHRRALLAQRPEQEEQVDVDLSNVLVDPAAITLVPKEIARRYILLPLSVDVANKVLTLAIADPDNIIALDQVRALLRDEYRLVTQLASESDILVAIDQYYGFELSIDGILHEIEPGEMDHQNLQQE